MLATEDGVCERVFSLAWMSAEAGAGAGCAGDGLSAMSVWRTAIASTMITEALLQLQSNRLVL